MSISSWLSSLKSALRFWNRKSPRDRHTPDERKTRRNRRRRPHISLELLEDRIAPAITPTLAAPLVTFAGSAAGDVLHLRVVAGKLEYAQVAIPSNGDFTNDLSASPGEQSLTISATSNIQVNLLDGDDRLVIDASLTDALRSFSGSSLTFNAGNTGETLGDVIAVGISGSNPVTLSDTQITSGAATIALLDSEAAELTGGSGANTFTLAGWTGNATLQGAGGTDTYAFGNSWGNASINDSDNGGVLDFFPQFTGTLQMRTPSATAEQHEVTGTNGAVTSTINYAPGANFTSDAGILDAAKKTALNGGLDALVDLGDRLDTTGKLNQPLFMLANQTLGGVIDVGGTLDSVITAPVATYIAGSPTLDGIIKTLSQTAGVTVVGTLASSGQLTLEIGLDVSRTVSNIDVSFGNQIGDVVHFDNLRGNVNTQLQWQFEVAISAAGAFTATYETTAPLLHAAADLVVDVPNLIGRAGFLGLNFGAGSTSSVVSLDADINVNTNSISALGTSALNALAASTLPQTGAALAKIDLRGSTTVAGISVTGISGDATISLTGGLPGGVFDLLLPTPLVFANNFAGLGISSFSVIDAGGLRSQLVGLADVLGIFGAKTFAAALPLSGNGVTLGDAIDLQGEFERNFLNLLERQPLTTGMLVSSLNGGKGIRTVAGKTDLRVTLSNGTTFDVDLDSAASSTIGALLTAIRNAAPGSVSAAAFEVRIDPTSGGVTLVDRTGGAGIFEVEALNGSQAAEDLGILGEGAPQLGESTLVRDLNGGIGVRTIAGNDFSVTIGTSPNAVSFDVDLSVNLIANPDMTLLDLMKAIRNAAPDTLTSAHFEVVLDTTTLGVRIIDKTGPDPVDATVTAINGSLAKDDLGLGEADIGRPQIIAQNIGYPGPNYSTIQEMAAKVGTQISAIQYQNSGPGGLPTLKFQLNVGLSNSTTDALKLFDTGALTNLVTTGAPNLSIGATGTLSMPFEVQLVRPGQSFNLGTGTTSTFPVSGLNLGAGVRTIAGMNDIRITLSNGTFFDVNLDHSPAGVLLSDLSLNTNSNDDDFDVTLSDNSTFAFDLDQSGMTTLAHLAAKLNEAAAGEFGNGQTKFLAAVDPARGSLVLIDRSVPALGGSFQVSPRLGVNINGLKLGAAATKLLDNNLELFIEGSFTTVGHLMQKISNAADAAGLSTAQFEVRIGADGKGLLLIDGTEGVSGPFAVTSLNDSNANRDLGLIVDGVPQPLTNTTPVAELNRGAGVHMVAGADLQVTLRNGTSFNVDLTASATIGDLLQLIQNAANTHYGAGQTVFRTGLNESGAPTLFDLSTGGGTFQVAAVGLSNARDDLGLTASGIASVDPQGNPAHAISVTSKTLFLLGSPLHGDTSSAHIGVRNATLNAAVSLSGSGINGAGQWGPVDVVITGGSATGALTFAMTFADTGTSAADGLATLRELRGGLASPDDLFAANSLTGSLSLTLPLQVTPAIGGLAPVTLTVSSANVFAAAAPSMNFTGDADTISFLQKAAQLKVADVLTMLEGTAEYLKKLESQSQFATQINLLAYRLPGLNRSVGQLLGFGTRFGVLIETLRADPPETLQDLQTALDALDGISGVSFSFDDTVSAQEALAVDLTFDVSQFSNQRFDLQLAPLDLAANPSGDLEELGLDTIGMVLDAKNSSLVPVNVSGSLSLAMGVGLTNPANFQGFLGDSTSMSFDLSAVKNNLSFSALFGARNVDIVGGNFLIDADGNAGTSDAAAYTVELADDALDHRHLFNQAEAATATTLDGAIHAAIPVEYPLELNEDDTTTITLDVVHDVVAATTTTLEADGPNVRDTLAASPLNGNVNGLRNGFGELFRLLDIAFDAAVFSRELPFVGTQLTKAVNFIEQIRDKVEDNFDLNVGIMTIDVAKQALFDAFGPGGLNWLQDNNADTFVNIDDIIVTNSASQSLFDMSLVMPPQRLEYPVDVDLILPGLGLKIDAQAQVDFGFSMPLKFGISTTSGVFLDPATINDLTIQLDVTLPTPPPGGFAAILGTLPYRVLQLPGPTARLLGNFDFKLVDGDGKLTLAELTAAVGTGQTLQQLQTSARQMILGGFSTSSPTNLNLLLQTDLPEGAALPTYKFEVHIQNWGFTAPISATNQPTVFGETTPTIEIHNTQFELVSFMRDFMGAALTRLERAFRPMDPIVDLMTNELFPIISLVFGRAPYVSARSFGGGVEIGDFAGASEAIRRIVTGQNNAGSFSSIGDDGGVLVGTPANPLDTYAPVPFDLVWGGSFGSMPDQLMAVGPLAALIGERWIDIGSSVANQADATLPGAQARLALPRGKTHLTPQNIHARAFGAPDDPVAGDSIMAQVRAAASDPAAATDPAVDKIQDAALGFMASQMLAGRQAFEGFFGGAIRALLPFGIDPIELPILKNAGGNAANSFHVMFGDAQLGNSAAVAKDTNLLKYSTPELFLYLYQDIPLDGEQIAGKVLKEPSIGQILKQLGAKFEVYIAVAFEARADFGVAFDTTGLVTFAQTHNPADLANGFYFDDQIGIEANGPNQQKAVGSNSDPDEARILGGVGLGMQIVASISLIQIKVGVEVMFFMGSAWNLHDPDNSDASNRIRAQEFDINNVPDRNVFDQSFVLEFRADIFFKLTIGYSIFKITIFDIRFNLGTTTFDIPFPDDHNDLPSLGDLDGSGVLTLNLTHGGVNADKIVYIGMAGGPNDVIVSTAGHTQKFTGVIGVLGTSGSGNDQFFVAAELTVPVTISAGAGNDRLQGGGGRADFQGGAGADTIVGGAANDILFGGADNDYIFGGDGNDIIVGEAGNDTLIGWRDDDNINGDDGIGGVDGADIIRGGSGNDTLGGGNGDDDIEGGLGNDIIHGGAGLDSINGGDGADNIFGDANNDTIHGGLGNDVIHGDAGLDDLFGDQHNDTIFGDADNDAIDGGGASDEVQGGGGDDVLRYRDGNDFLNGNAGDDTYLIFFAGRRASSLVTVLDSGGPADSDVFVAQGTVLADQFLLRASASISFVALINSLSKVERVNYFSVERIVVNGSLGNDKFASDNTTSEITLNGEEGDDSFQIGQLFRSERTFEAANVAVDDVFATIETTRGFLSNGISQPMTVNGGLGNDRFVVFHNKAVLTLNGDEGDDIFEVRAFALIGSQEPQRGRTDITGGAGADLVQYAVNAPVNINGGDGFDTLVIIGTEFGDDFVVTKEGVFGAGITVDFVNIESLRVDGAEGNDRFYVKSTKETFSTELFGGLGADTFSMSGDAPSVVSNDLRGHSGIILHEMETTSDVRFDDQQLHGISANVADNDEPGVVIRPSGGATIVTEGNAAADPTLIDSYDVVLTFRPTTDVFVKALAPIPSPNRREQGMLAFRLWSPTGTAKADGSVVTLLFTPSNWDVPQTVEVRADQALVQDAAGLFTRPELGAGIQFDYDDDAVEGVSNGTINHIVQAGVNSAQSSASALSVSPTLTIPRGTVSVNNLIGKIAQITAGPGAGQQRRIVFAELEGSDNIKLTLDIAWLVSGPLPGAGSTFLIDMDVGADPTGAPIAATNPTVTMNRGALELDQFPGRLVEIVGGPGAGQTRFIIAVEDVDGTRVKLTLDRGWSLTDQPVNSSAATPSSFLVRVDDAFVGNMTGFSESPAFTFTDLAADFPTDDEGLRGAVLQIVGGPGAGQQRLILSNTDNTLTLNGGWSTDPVPNQSIYRIARYDGIAVPSVSVQINDNDGPSLIVDESKGIQATGPIDATDMVADSDNITAVIEGGDGNQRGEVDVLRVRLARLPTANVTVNLFYDSQQLTLSALGSATAINFLTFTILNWNTFQVVQVKAAANMLREGFHTGLVRFSIASDDGNSIGTVTTAAPETFTIPATDPTEIIGLTHMPRLGVLTQIRLNGVPMPPWNGGTGTAALPAYELISNKIVFHAGAEYVKISGTITVAYDYDKPGYNAAFTKPVLVQISDDDAPTVLVRQTAGSTDVVESNAVTPPHDTYELVLTAQPTARVAVTVTPDITKTTRTGGIRNDLVQVIVADPSGIDARIDPNGDGSLTIVLYDPAEGIIEWDKPVVIKVTAIDDVVIDGGDTQVIAREPRTLSGIVGPLMVDGAGGQGSLTGIAAPIMLDGETNVKRKTGDVVTVVGNLVTVHTADLETLLGPSFASLLVGRTLEVTAATIPNLLNPTHSAIGQFRLIEQVTPASNGLTVLRLNEGFKYNLTFFPGTAQQFMNVGEGDVNIRSYAITQESLNFFVNEPTLVDVMFVHDQDSPADTAGELTSTRLTGLNMGPDLEIGGKKQPSGITYGNLEVLDINLGRGNNSFNVLSTHTRADGYQTWTFIKTGDDVPWNGVQGDTVTVNVQAAETQSTFASLTGGGAANSTATSFATLTKTGAFSTANGGLRGQLVTVSRSDTLGTPGDDQTRRILGNTADTLFLDRDWETLPNATYSYKIVRPADGAIAIDTQDGDDIVNAAQSTLGIVVFGGLGNDTITGGSADDILFGDRGRVDYFNAAGAIVTRLGTAPLPIIGKATDDFEFDDRITDDNANFPTPDSRNIGLRGLYVDINNGTAFLQEPRLITDNTAHTLFVGLDFTATLDVTSAYRISTYPEDQTDGVKRAANLLITVDDNDGGDDEINAGTGDDQVFGGAGDDEITTGAGADVVLGDAGRIDRDAEAVTDPEIGDEVGSVIRKIRAFDSDGGDDTILTGVAEDIVLGGGGGDLISTIDIGAMTVAAFRTLLQNGNTPAIPTSDNAATQDLVFGDHGTLDFNAAGVLITIFSTAPDNGGNDSIVTGNGPDMVFGGDGDDLILAGGIDLQVDYVFGDNGRINFTTNPTVTQMLTTDGDFGGDDVISTGAGPDIAFGGAGNDVIVASNRDTASLADIRAQLVAGQAAAIPAGDTAEDVVFGDNGVIDYVAANEFLHLFSIDPQAPGNDSIVTGNGADIVVGGAGNDLIVAGGTDDEIDRVLGDNGRMTFDSTEEFDDADERFSTISVNFNGTALDGTVTGSAGAIPAATWNNLSGGGPTVHGDQAEEPLYFNDGVLAPGVTIEWGKNLGTPTPAAAGLETHDEILFPATVPANDQQQRLFEGFLSGAATDTLGVNIKGLGWHFLTYDVYVYLDADDRLSALGNSVRHVAGGSSLLSPLTTYYLQDDQGNTFEGTFVEVTSTDSNSPQVGNYVVFRGVTSDEFFIRITTPAGDVANRPVITGLQIHGEHHAIDRIETALLPNDSASYAPQHAGNDRIYTGGGPDIILAGAGDDYVESFGAVVRGSTDGDVIVGDEGRVTLTTLGSVQEVRRLESAMPETTTGASISGNDRIRSGNGNDHIVSGNGNDIVDSGVQGPYDNGDVQIISLKFNSDNPEANITGTAGVVAADNWNNLLSGYPDAKGKLKSSTSDVIFADGTFAAGINVQWGIQTAKLRAALKDTHDQLDPDSQNERLFESYLYTTVKKTLGVTVTGLSAYYSSYDVYVYLDADDSKSNLLDSPRSLTIGSKTYTLHDPDGNTFAGTFIEGTNYVVFENVSGNVFSISVNDEPIAGKANKSNPPAISGLQIVGGAAKDDVVLSGDYDRDVVVGDNGIIHRRDGLAYDATTKHGANAAGQFQQDIIHTGVNGDVVLAGNGDDRVSSGEGNDLVLGDNGRALLFGGQVIGFHGTAPYSILGARLLDNTYGSNDTLEGGADDDLLYGQIGNDTYVFAGGGLGRDRLVESGGVGNDLHDRLDFTDFIGKATVDLEEAAPQTVNNGRLNGDINLIVTLYSQTAFEDVTGSSFDDVIDGNIRNNTLVGRQGNDTIVGADGNDLIDGGEGDDTLTGDNPGTPIGSDEDQGGGGDGANDGRDVILGGAGNDAIRGNGNADLIDGEEGDDRIFGDSGDDILFGGAGADTLFGGGGANQIDGVPGPLDLLAYFNTFGYGFVAQATNLPVRPWVQDFLAASGAANTFVRVDPNDPFNTALFVYGTNAADNITVHAGVAAGSFAATVNGQTSADFTGIGRIYVFGLAGDDLIQVDENVGTLPTALDGGFGNDIIFGGKGDDGLSGDFGNDYLDGRSGNDWLDGNAGRDFVVGGFGSDQVVGSEDDDIVIGGVYVPSSSTTTPDVNAIKAVMAQWSRSDAGYAQRVYQLRHGLAGGIKVNNDTVIGDGARDIVFGKQGLDWLFSDWADVTDRRGNEIAGAGVAGAVSLAAFNPPLGSQLLPTVPGGTLEIQLPINPAAQYQAAFVTVDRLAALAAELDRDFGLEFKKTKKKFKLGEKLIWSATYAQWLMILPSGQLHMATKTPSASTLIADLSDGPGTYHSDPSKLYNGQSLPLTETLTPTGAGGSLVAAPDGSGTLEVVGGNKVVFTPAVGLTGQVRMRVTVTVGPQSNSETITINVTDVPAWIW